jgi:oxidase EvaA
MKTESILDWFERQQEESSIISREAEEPLVGQWEVDPNSPVPIERRDGKFFKVVNITVEAGSNREVETWDQPMIQPAETVKIHDKQINGIVALFRNRMMGRIRYLVQAKAEPGNDTPGRVILAPTIQASASNMDLHRDKIPFLNQLDLDSEDSRYIIQPKDGERFFEANNILAIQDAKRIKEIPSDYIWATREAVRELQQKDLVNEHLNEVLGVFG